MNVEVSPSTETLIRAFKAAAEAARTLGDSEDDGTSNFDSAVVRPERYSARYKTAAKVAGLELIPITWYHGRAYWVRSPVPPGQGDRRNRIAMAMDEALRANGVDSSVYLQMD